MPSFQIVGTQTHIQEVTLSADNVKQAVHYVVTDQLNDAQWLSLDETQEITSIKTVTYEVVPKEEYQDEMNVAF